MVEASAWVMIFAEAGFCKTILFTLSCLNMNWAALCLLRLTDSTCAFWFWKLWCLFCHCWHKYQVWDLGGQDRLRTSWATYYRGTHAAIVVIDSTDRARITIMKDELFRLLQHDDLQNSVILVFANKQDIKDAMTPAEITDALSLHSIKNHDWHIQACCALTGDGLYDGLGWIAQRVTGKASS